MATKSCSSLRQKQGFVLGGRWCVLFFSPCFLGMPGLRERRIAGGCSRISLRLFGVWDGGQYAFACRVRAGGEVGEDVVLFGVFAFVGGGRGVISYSTPPTPAQVPHSPKSVPWLRLWRGVHPKRAPWQRVANLVCPHPVPSTEGCTREAAGASSASRAPRPSHSQTIGDLCSPPRCPHPRSPTASAAATSLFTRCRGSGVATSHVSRGPGAPGRTAPHGAGQR